MIPAPFDYRAPRTLEEAVALLQSHGASSGDAKVLSGGQSLLPLLYRSALDERANLLSNAREIGAAQIA
jgi:CO/xanthine dehydrogenase FAD-binding subunit